MLANAAGQSIHLPLTHRIREQARSHILIRVKPQNGALKNQCPFSGISYTDISLVPPFKTIIRNYIRNYGAEIATCDPSDTVQ